MSDIVTNQQAGAATATPEMMSWDSRTRRMITIYLPLAIFVFILLFPFYWMSLTAIKPNGGTARLQDP